MVVKKNVTVVSKKIVTLLVTNVVIRQIMNKRANDVNVKIIPEQTENTNVRHQRAHAVPVILAPFLVPVQFVQMNWIALLNRLVMEKVQNVLYRKPKRIIHIVIKIQWSVTKVNAPFLHVFTFMALLNPVNVRSMKQQVRLVGLRYNISRCI